MIGTISFSIFLMTIGWALVRPKQRASSPESDSLAQQYALGALDDDEFAERMNDLRTGRKF